MRPIYFLVALLSSISMFFLPLTVMRDLTNYIEVFGQLGLPNTLVFVRFVYFILWFSFTILIVRRLGPSVSLVIIFVSFLTLGANQLRLLLAINLYIYFRNRVGLGWIASMSIHGSMLISPVIKFMRREYSLLWLVLVSFAFSFNNWLESNLVDVARLNSNLLGDAVTYIEVMEISDIYSSARFVDGIEWLFMVVVVFRLGWELIFMTLLFVLFKYLALPSIILMRIFELLVYLMLLNKRSLIRNNWGVVGSLLVVNCLRLRYHYV